MAINKKMDELKINAWRVAHSGLILGGILLLVVALVAVHLNLNRIMYSSLILAFTISAYGFLIALPLGAWKGFRGLKPKPRGINTIVYLGNVIGSLASLVGALILFWGTLRLLF